MPWARRKARKRHVLYVLGEGVAGAGLRVAAWQQRHWPIENMLIYPDAIQVSDRATWAELASFCVDTDVGMIVIDTQSRMMCGLDENGSVEMGTYVRLVTDLRDETRATVLTVHHTGTAGSRPRGHTVLDGAAEAILMVRRPVGTTLLATVETTKQKDLPEIDGGLNLDLEVVPLGPRPGWPGGITSLAVVGERPRDGHEDPFAGVGGMAAQEALVRAIIECGLGQGLTKGEAWRLVRAQGVDEAPFLAAWNRAIGAGVLGPSECSPTKFVLMEK
jgi:hypothetical protein